jgi:hypothetical protein
VQEAPPDPSSDGLLTWLREHADEHGRVTGVRNFYLERGHAFARMQRLRRTGPSDLDAGSQVRRVGPPNSAVYEIVR